MNRFDTQAWKRKDGKKEIFGAFRAGFLCIVPFFATLIALDKTGGV